MKHERQGLEVRVLAASALHGVLNDGMMLDDVIASEPRVARLDARDRALLHSIVLTALRRKGELDAAIKTLMSKPLPRKSGLAGCILLVGAAQLRFMSVPHHAAIDLAVESARQDRDGRHFSGLVNAVLRKLGQLEPATVATRVNTPQWLWERWSRAYGEQTADAIAQAHFSQPAVDITVKSDAPGWAERLGGVVLSPGSVRLGILDRPVAELAGYADGEWWVQDFAASLPVSLLGGVQGLRVLDLCSAPGGKTMQLAAGGATVVSVDQSERRLGRLRENLARTRLQAEVICADVLAQPLPTDFDLVLLDAPCSATGTIRRHPDLPYLRSEQSVRALAAQQEQMLQVAAKLVRPGGRLVYCTCSLEPEEGEAQVAALLASGAGFAVEANLPVPPGLLTSPSGIRTFPSSESGNTRGMDGFFISVMKQSA